MLHKNAVGSAEAVSIIAAPNVIGNMSVPSGSMVF